MIEKLKRKKKIFLADSGLLKFPRLYPRRSLDHTRTPGQPSSLERAEVSKKKIK
jgi:hypothetical protein